MVRKKLFKTEAEERAQDFDTLLKEFAKYRSRYPKTLVAYYPYPSLKEALVKGEIALWRDDDGNIVGHVWVKNLKRLKYSRLEEIYTLQHGLGSLMLEEAEKMCHYPDFMLYVLKTNERAIRFYRKHGFKAEGEKKDMDMMHKSLGKHLNLEEK